MNTLYKTHHLRRNRLLLTCLLFLSILTAKAGTNSNKRILDQAALFTQAIKTERYDVVAVMSPPSLTTTLGGVAGYEKTIREVLSDGSILDCKADSILSTATCNGEMFATVSTMMSFNQDDETAKINSYLIAVSDDSGRKWWFINGSDKMRAFLRTYSPEMEQQLIFPDVTMEVDNLTFIKRGDNWILDDKTLKDMKRLLKNAKQNQR